MIGAVINKLMFEQVNAIFIVPRFMRYWTAMLRQLPIVAVHELPFKPNMYSIGSRCPKSMQLNKTTFLLNAYLVRFR